MSKKNNRPNIIQRAALQLIKAGAWRPQTMSDLDRWMDSIAYGGSASSGALVSGDTAVNFAAFFSGVLQICQTLASCDVILYQEKSDYTKTAWKAHPVYGLLTRKANPYMNFFTWKERMQYHAMIWGNGYSFIQRDYGLRPMALWPLNPERVSPKIDEENRLVYEYRPVNGEKTVYSQDEIFHLPGFGFDSIKGYSLLEIARETIGLGLSQQEFTGRFISNGAHLGGLLTSKNQLSDDARARLKTQFAELHSGTSNAGKFAVLEEEMDYKPLGMPLADAQFLESKVFQIAEIARFLNISPYKLKDYSHATFSNIEHLGIEYATDTIRPWAERWEAAIDTQLLTPAEQLRGYAEFDLLSIQRGDMKTQAEALNMLRNAGAYSADEIRYKLGDNPIEDPRVGKMYWRPENMADASVPYVGRSATTGAGADPSATLKAEIEAYAVAVRGGVITPQPEDEEHFRIKAGVPEMSKPVIGAWKDDGNVRRPRTLRPNAKVVAESTPQKSEDAESDHKEEGQDEE